MTMRLKHYDCSLSNIQTTEKPKTLLIHSLVENIQSVLPLPHREPCHNYLRDILSQGWWSRWLYQKGGKSEPCRNQGNRREKKKFMPQKKTSLNGPTATTKWLLPRCLGVLTEALSKSQLVIQEFNQEG